jgi:hypothetical protein
VLAAKGNDELLVGLLLASLVEDAHVCLATIESLGSLTETAGESVVDQRDLEDTLEGIEDGHGTGLSGLIGANFDLLGGGDGAGGLFYIRLLGFVLVMGFSRIVHGRGIAHAHTKCARCMFSPSASFNR